MMEGSAKVSAKVFETGLVYVAVESWAFPIPALRSAQSRSTPPRPNNLARPRYLAGVISSLSFQTAAGDAFDDVSLGEDIHDEHGDAGQHAAGHYDRVLRVICALKNSQTRRQGEACRAEEHVHRPQKVIPVDQEAQDRERGKRGFGERQDDAEKDLEAISPVYEGRLLQLQRQRYEELSQKEDPERPGRPRYYLGQQSVQPAEVFDYHVITDDEDELRYDQRQDYNREHHVLAAEVHPGQCVGRRRSRDEHQQRVRGSGDHAIEEPPEDGIGRGGSKYR